MSKGFGDSSHQKFPQATKGLHPIKKLISEQSQSGNKSQIAKFLKRRWKELSALSWKGYLEMGQGALFLTIDDLVLAGGNTPVEYVDERECFNPEVMSGYQPMGEITTKVNTYDPNREITAVLRWRGRQGYLVAIYSDALTTPKQNYTYLGLQADNSRFPLCKGGTEEQAAKNASTHPRYAISRGAVGVMGGFSLERIFGVRAWCCGGVVRQRLQEPHRKNGN